MANHRLIDRQMPRQLQQMHPIKMHLDLKVYPSLSDKIGSEREKKKERQRRREREATNQPGLGNAQRPDGDWKPKIIGTDYGE